MANNLSKGEQLVGGKTLNDNVPLFTDMFEVSLGLLGLCVSEQRVPWHVQIHSEI